MLTAFSRSPALPLTLRKKIGKCLSVPEAKIFTRPVLDVRYTGRTGNHIDNKVYLYGCHEAATIRLIRTLLRECENPVFLDIGTNTGLHLITAAPKCDAAYGFEPWGEVRTLAQNNIDLNEFENVTLFPFGLSDEDAEIPYVTPDAGNLGAGFFAPEEAGNDHPTLKVRHGDTVIKENGIIPGVIKIDVEGFEPYVMKGLEQTIRTHKPDIIFEYNAETRRRDENVLTTITDILGPDYALYGILRSREYPKLKPFSPTAKYENVLATTRPKPV